MKIIDKIENDQDIKKLSLKEQIILAQEVRDLIIDTAKNTPLHLSSNLGIVELTIAILNNFNLQNDKILYDTGHQTYVHKILTGRRDLFHTIRKDNGLFGFMNMTESEYDHYSPGHSGNILSIASGMYQSLKENNKDSKRLKFYNNKNIVAIVGDAAFANGLSFEALNDIAFNKEPIIIILNDNEMSISKAVGALSQHLSSIKTSKFFRFFERGIRHILNFNKCYYTIFNFYNWCENHLFTKNLFKNLGFNYIGPIDGHNIKKVNQALAKSKWFAHQGPIIVHVKTKKGYGLKEAEADLCGNFHSFNHEVKNDDSFGIIATKKVIELMEKDKQIFVLNPAMTRSSNCEAIIDKYPQRYIDVGIAEEHAIAKASGMALVGLKPIVYIYASFLQRAYDQLLHDCSRLQLPITLLIDRADPSGGDGPTHHGVYDVGFLKTIENTCITTPRNIDQLNQLIDLSQQNQHSIYAIRYPKWYFSENKYNYFLFKIKPYQWEWFDRFKSKTIIVSYGPMVNCILQEVCDIYKIDLVNAIYINQYSKKEIKRIFDHYSKIIVYERIKTNNGLVQDFYQYQAENNLNCEIIAMNYYQKPLDHGALSSLDKKAFMDINAIIQQIKNKD